MGLFDHFPYTNFHELNLDWILKMLQQIDKTMDEFVAINALKYADPIQWNITTQYEKNTIVIDPQTGTAYISVAPVPTGVSLSNPDYWTVVFDLGQFVVRASKNFANTYEADTTLTATVSTAAGSWIVWGDTLYKALVNITAGDSYVIGGNIAHFTMEDVIGHLEDLNTTDKSNVVAAINEIVTNLAAEVLARQNADGDLNNLTTTDKSSLVAAINEIMTVHLNNLVNAINNEANARTNADNELRELIGNMHWIFIGDSYNAGANPDGDPFNPYGNRIINKLGLTESYSAGLDGAAFTSSGYLAVLQGIENNVTYPEHITDIMVCGGYNDRILSAADITSGISDFVAYCHSQYPNARVHVGCIGRHRGDTTIQTAIHNISLMSFMQCVNYGATFIKDSDLCLHTYANFTSDNIHPNDNGQEEIATALCNYVLGKGISKHGVALPFTVSNSSIGTVAGSGYMEIDNNMISMEFTALSLAITTPTTITCSGTPLDMGIISGAYITSSMAYFTSVDTALTIHNGSDYQTVHGSLKIGADNHLYFTPVDTNGSGFTPIVNATNIEAYGKPIALNLNATII